MQVEITDAQIKQVQSEWAEIRRQVASSKARQADYSCYYTFHSLLGILGLLDLLNEEASE